jgi:hypothetical protein
MTFIGRIPGILALISWLAWADYESSWFVRYVSFCEARIIEGYV